MASIQEIVARRSSVTSLPQASPNPNRGVGITSDAGSGGFRQLGQVRGIPLNTATGFGEAGMIDANSVGAIGQTIGQIATAVDELNEASEKARLISAGKLADKKIAEWNSISDEAQREEFRVKQVAPALERISSERKNLTPIANNSRNARVSEMGILGNVRKAKSAESTSYIEKFKLGDLVRESKNIDEFTENSQRYMAHVYSMLDSNLLTTTQATNLINTSRALIDNEQTNQVVLAYSQGVQGMGINELIEVNETLRRSDVAFPSNHRLSPLEKLLEKTSAHSKQIITKVFKAKLENLKATNDYKGELEDKAYREALVDIFPNLDNALSNIVLTAPSQRVVKQQAEAAIREVREKVGKNSPKISERLDKLVDRTTRRYIDLKKTEETDLLESIPTLLFQKTVGGESDFKDALGLATDLSPENIKKIIKADDNFSAAFNDIKEKNSSLPVDSILFKIAKAALTGGSITKAVMDKSTAVMKKMTKNAIDDADRETEQLRISDSQQKKIKAKNAQEIYEAASNAKGAEHLERKLEAWRQQKKVKEADPKNIEKERKAQLRENFKDLSDKVVVANVSQGVIEHIKPEVLRNTKAVSKASSAPENTINALTEEGIKHLRDLQEIGGITAQKAFFKEIQQGINKLNKGYKTLEKQEKTTQGISKEILDPNRKTIDEDSTPEGFDPMEKISDADPITESDRPLANILGLELSGKNYKNLGEFRKKHPEEYTVLEQLTRSRALDSALTNFNKEEEKERGELLYDFSSSKVLQELGQRSQVQGAKKAQIEYIKENIVEWAEKIKYIPNLSAMGQAIKEIATKTGSVLHKGVEELVESLDFLFKGTPDSEAGEFSSSSGKGNFDFTPLTKDAAGNPLTGATSTQVEMDIEKTSGKADVGDARIKPLSDIEFKAKEAVMPLGIKGGSKSFKKKKVNAGMAGELSSPTATTPTQLVDKPVKKFDLSKMTAKVPTPQEHESPEYVKYIGRKNFRDFVKKGAIKRITGQVGDEEVVFNVSTTKDLSYYNNPINISTTKKNNTRLDDKWENLDIDKGSIEAFVDANGQLVPKFKTFEAGAKAGLSSLFGLGGRNHPKTKEYVRAYNESDGEIRIDKLFVTHLGTKKGGARKPYPYMKESGGFKSVTTDKDNLITINLKALAGEKEKPEQELAFKKVADFIASVHQAENSPWAIGKPNYVADSSKRRKTKLYQEILKGVKSQMEARAKQILTRVKEINLENLTGKKTTLYEAIKDGSNKEKQEAIRKGLERIKKKKDKK